MQLRDPVSERQMKAVLFYPADAATSRTKVGPLVIAAAENAPVVRGQRYPLVLISHGNGGSLFSHHDSATFLAQHGFVAAAIEHPGDNFRDTSGQGTDRVLVGRNLQLSALLDHLLNAAEFGAVIDRSRIGVAGFSAGGYTALLMAGAKPKFALLKPYCVRQPDSVLCRGGGGVALSAPPLAPKADPRIRAAFVMSPVGAFFDRESLSQVEIPVYLYAAANDEVLPADENARKVKSGLRVAPKYAEVAAAGHFVFLAPCSPDMKSVAAALCTDPPQVDRTAVHEQLNREAVLFFKEKLAAP